MAITIRISVRGHVVLAGVYYHLFLVLTVYFLCSQHTPKLVMGLYLVE